MTMHKYLAIFALVFSVHIFSDAGDSRLVSELTIAELKETVRAIVEESIERCLVTGTMEGRAKVNLKVEGEVVAKMECNFTKAEPTIPKIQ